MKKIAKRSCPCCGRRFRPTSRRNIYYNDVHRNRAKQQRLRQRAKKYYDMRAEVGGVGG